MKCRLVIWRLLAKHQHTWRDSDSNRAQLGSVEQVAAVDTNGAGDTFATAYMLAMARGARSPGAVANWVASRAVMHEQACKPHCVLEGILLGSSYAQYRQWVRCQVRPQLSF